MHPSAIPAHSNTAQFHPSGSQYYCWSTLQSAPVSPSDVPLHLNANLLSPSAIPVHPNTSQYSPVLNSASQLTLVPCHCRPASSQCIPIHPSDIPVHPSAPSCTLVASQSHPSLPPCHCSMSQPTLMPSHCIPMPFQCILIHPSAILLYPSAS